MGDGLEGTEACAWLVLAEYGLPSMTRRAGRHCWPCSVVLLQLPSSLQRPLCLSALTDCRQSGSLTK